MTTEEDAREQAWFARHVTWWARCCFGLGGLGVLGAGVLLSATSWSPDAPWVGHGAAWAVGAMAAGLTLVTLGGYSMMQQAPKQNRSEYAPFIFGLGILMAGVGGTGIVGVAGLIHARHLDRLSVLEEGEEATTDDAKARENEVALQRLEERRARFVLLAGAMAFIGSLFYIALALWRKQHHAKHVEAFDVGKLVSGAALRCGEAMLFTLVFVLLTQVGGSLEFDGWLPVMGLMLGMFVKSGERLVFNLATRIFDLAESIVPASKGARSEAPSDEPDELDGPDPIGERAAAPARDEDADDDGNGASAPAAQPRSVPPPS